MARFGRRKPVPWHRPVPPAGLFAPSAAGSSAISGTAAGVLTLLASAAGSSAISGLATASGAPAPVSSLPVLDVWIAFNPLQGGATLATAPVQALPASGTSNAYWTNVAVYVRDFRSRHGRQHFLDRVEAGSLQLTVDNRSGFFLNGTSAGNNTGYVIQPRLPIAVTATWSGTTYNLFWGLTEAPEERISDQLNTDLLITAIDQLKGLSLQELNRPNFYSTYARSASATNWYRCSLNGANTTIFPDQIGTNNATIKGYSAGSLITQASAISYPQAGALIYDPDTCCDLANGSNLASGAIQLPQTSYTGLDLWILGAGLVDGVVIALGLVVAAGGTAYNANLVVNGHVAAVALTQSNVLGAPTAYYQVTNVNLINDGFWHHVGWFVSGNALYVYQDGNSNFVVNLNSGSYFISGNSPGVAIGVGGKGNPQLPAYIDEIVVSGQGGSGYPQVTSTEFTNRYAAGSLLQNGYPKHTVYSGDRIAEILVLAGYGSIANGTLSLNAGIFFINGSAYSLYGVSANGSLQVEPYYWDSPLTGSTPLGLIQQITDTDIGAFYQAPDGSFRFLTQTRYGSFAWPAITSASSSASVMTFNCVNSFSAGQTVVVTGMAPAAYNGAWTIASASGSAFTVSSTLNPGASTVGGNAGVLSLTYTPPAGDHIWADDGSSAYAYVGPSAQILRDDADLWTVVRVTPQAGVDQVFDNTGAQGRWGFSTLRKNGTVHPSLAAALTTAAYLGYLGHSPLPRVGNVELQSETSHGGNMTAIIGTALFDPVTFKRLAPNASSSGSYPDVQGKISADMIAEAIMLEFAADPGYLHASFILDPYPLRS